MPITPAEHFYNKVHTRADDSLGHRRGEPHLLLSEIEDCVISADKDIPQDPDGFGQVDAHKSRNALARNLQDVLLGLQRKGLAI